MCVMPALERGASFCRRMRDVCRNRKRHETLDVLGCLDLHVDFVWHALRMVQRAFGKRGGERRDVAGFDDAFSAGDMRALARSAHLYGEKSVVVHGSHAATSNRA